MKSGDEPSYIPRSALVHIIHPRVEETLLLVKARLSEHGVDDVSGNRVVLTGGASQLVGMKELATQIFNKQVRVASPVLIEGLAESTKGPAFSASVGMLRYGAKKALSHKKARDKTSNTLGKGYYGRVLCWLKENF